MHMFDSSDHVWINVNLVVDSRNPRQLPDTTIL